MAAKEQDSEQHFGWQIFSQALVVVLGLTAIVVALALILNTYDVKEDAAPPATTATAATQQAVGSGTSGQSSGKNGGASTVTSTNASEGDDPDGPDGGTPTEAATPASVSTSVSSSSVVAILTPIMAGIVGMAGLFFGVSATGSARGRQAGTEQTVADTNAKTADLLAQVQEGEASSARAGNGEEGGSKSQTEPRGGDPGF